MPSRCRSDGGMVNVSEEIELKCCHFGCWLELGLRARAFMRLQTAALQDSTSLFATKTLLSSQSDPVSNSAPIVMLNQANPPPNSIASVAPMHLLWRRRDRHEAAPWGQHVGWRGPA